MNANPNIGPNAGFVCPDDQVVVGGVTSLWRSSFQPVTGGEEKGFRRCAMKMTTASKDLLEMHFADLSSKPFFPKLVEFMLSGPVVVMVWEGKGAVKTDRKMLGETNPVDSLPGTIRGNYCIDIGRKICRGSDSVETAKKEIALWFKEGELNNYCCANNSWVYE